MGDVKKRSAIRAALAALVVVFLLPGLVGCGGQRSQAPTIMVRPAPAERYPHPELLADTAWLAGQLNDPFTRVVDLSPLADYERGHIPGAVHVWWQDLVETHNDTYGMLRDPAGRKRVMEAAGIEDGMAVVAYDNAGGRYAARFLWTLMYTGYGGGRLLNGGIATWRAEGRPITRAVPTIAPSHLTDRATNETVLFNGGDLLARLGDRDLAIVDNRSAAEVQETWEGRLRRGRIPGARAIPWERNLGQLRTAVVRDPVELTSVYQKEALRRDQEIIVYGLTGVGAAHTFWIMRVLGYDNVKLYDGSWAQWGADIASSPYRNQIEPPAVGALPREAGGLLSGR